VTEIGMPAARANTSVSYFTVPPSSNDTVRFCVSTAVTTPSSVVTSLRLRTKWRMGHAISEVASDAVPDLIQERLE